MRDEAVAPGPGRHRDGGRERAAPAAALHGQHEEPLAPVHGGARHAERGGAGRDEAEARIVAEGLADRERKLGAERLR